MFNHNKDFYPTSLEVIQMMGIDCSGKICLEPQAGKRDIVKYLFDNGAKEVLTCELHPDLSKIKHKRERFLGHDFLKLTADKISHVNLIVMNPPFSNGTKHLLHAWNIAPDGCEIISLLNYENINHAYSREERETKSLIADYGHSTNLGNCFKQSERKTSVEVALVKLFKPKTGSNEFDGFFMGEDEPEPQGNGIMKYNVVRDIVQRYVNSVKCFEEHEAVSAKMNQYTDLFSVGCFTFNIGYDNNVTTKEDFKKELQKKGWAYLFDKMNLKKFVTSGVMKDINAFVETQTKVPFTMKNIYKMFEIIVGTREHTFNRSLIEAVDNFTRYTDENRFNVEGWKTNSGHLLNQKIIVPYMFESTYYNSDGSLSPKYSGNQDYITDLIKVLCNIEGEDYSALPTLYNTCRETRVKTNTWYDWTFFEIKGFKKGTMHLKFKDEDVWARLNQKYAGIKGAVLPEKYKPKKSRVS